MEIVSQFFFIILFETNIFLEVYLIIGSKHAIQLKYVYILSYPLASVL